MTNLEELAARMANPDIHSDDFMRRIEALAAVDREEPRNPYDIVTQGAEFLAWHRGFCAGDAYAREELRKRGEA